MAELTYYLILYRLIRIVSVHEQKYTIQDTRKKIRYIKEAEK